MKPIAGGWVTQPPWAMRIALPWTFVFYYYPVIHVFKDLVLDTNTHM